jgi:hypothetical protein
VENTYRDITFRAISSYNTSQITNNRNILYYSLWALMRDRWNKHISVENFDRNRML